MFRNILVPVDGSPLSMAAMRKAMALARESGAKTVALTVTEPFHTFSASPDQLEWTREQYDKHVGARAEEILHEVRQEASSLGVTCDALHTAQDDPYEAIVHVARDHGCDLIAMASHGRRGLAAIVLGSVTTKVLTHTQVPVLVYR